MFLIAYTSLIRRYESDYHSETVINACLSSGAESSRGNSIRDMQKSQQPQL